MTIQANKTGEPVRAINKIIESNNLNNIKIDFAVSQGLVYTTDKKPIPRTLLKFISKRYFIKEREKHKILFREFQDLATASSELAYLKN